MACSLQKRVGQEDGVAEVEGLDLETVFNAVKATLALGDPPKRLYHYTTFDFWKELSSGNADLCCTDFRELNDSKEYRYSLKCIEDALSKNFKSAKDQQDQNAKEKLHQLFGELHKINNFYIYSPWVFSLSSERDSLHQWVAYTDRRNGGVAIGFDAGKLKSFVEHKSGSKCRSYLMPCLYVHDGCFMYEGKELDFTTLFKKIVAGIESHENSDGLLHAFLVLASMIKDSSFSIEHEWRVILLFDDIESVSKADVIGGKLRVPFLSRYAVEMHDLIAEVWTAPHADINLARRSLMLPRIKDARWKYEQHHSKIPFKE